MAVKKIESVQTYIYAVSFLICMAIALGSVLYSVSARIVKQQLGSRCLGIATTVAALLEEHSGEYRDFIRTLDTTSDYYIRTKKLIEKIHDANKDNATFITMEVRFSENEVMYPLIGEKEGTALYSPPGTVEPFTETRRQAYETQSAVIGDFVTTQWGTLLSAYAPVFDTGAGEFIGLAGVDISIDQYDAIMRNYLAVITVSTVIIVFMGLVVIRLGSGKIRADRENITKSEFLSNMSHEMRTPLNAIIGMTAIGKSAPGVEKKDHAFEKIEIASAYLLQLINDILDMSKIEANKFELSETVFVFEEAIQGVINIIRFRAEEKHLTLTVNIDPHIPRRLDGDSLRLAQVITNLLSNAVKFTPEGGSIGLEMRFLGEEDGLCTIEGVVTDNGIGMSAEQQARLFTPFQQAESGRARKYGGTGLGLSISRRIVEMMGGSISVKSSAGKGSAFSFTLRLRRGPVPDEQSGGDTDNAQPPDDFAGHCILLAEDVEINREIVMEILSPTGVKIDCAENGAQALNLYRENPEKYSMILMDIQMPEMDGYEAARRIRALNNPRARVVPIVAVTANAFHEDVERCLEAGMSGHLSKPLDFDAVLDMLRKYLRKAGGVYGTGERQ
ncbi:MAG: response regulator [Spirochaetales bacterium]|jgi:signal transduction histidine kinase/ActR/RegA family two-component response regulator|nr:response regulator [Spirochaetales bacterium]